MSITRTIKQSSDEVINALINHMLIDKLISGAKFKELLEESLLKARCKAEIELSPVLFDALDWPTDLDSYEEYLIGFSRWIPRQSTNQAWKSSKSNDMREAFDRRCHFYWLIGQRVGEDSIKLSSVSWFSDWLIEFSNLWGSFLDTANSFNEDIFHAILLDSPKYRVQDSMIEYEDSEGEKWKKSNNPSGWFTFNQFFSRKLNQGLRPIAAPFDNKTIISPVDYTNKIYYNITKDAEFGDLKKNQASIKIKGTHDYGNVQDLLKDSIYREAFVGGKAIHYSLSPFSYQRFHAPVSGTIKELYSSPHFVYHDVNLTKGQYSVSVNPTEGFAFKQVRGVIIIDTRNSDYGDVGVVAVIPIGSAQASSVNILAAVGKETIKGNELGYFLFGSSDVIVLFQQHVYFGEKISSKNKSYGQAAAKYGQSSLVLEV